MEILDLNFYADKFLKIITKQSRLEPLAFNSYQKELTRIANEEASKGKPVRILVLKCRQIGGSTWGGAYNFHQVATNQFRNGLVIAHDEDSTNKLFNMCKRFYDFLPPKMKPMKRFSNRKELKFENPSEDERGESPGLMSGLEVETANNLNAGRGSPIQNLHCSEVAFWKNASTVITGLFQSVPYSPGTSIIIESTANGVSGHGEEFYNRCMSALKGESDFRFVFFKWTHNPEYEIEPPAGFTRTDYEKELCQYHPEVTDRKLAWRRYKIKNEMGGTLMNPEDQFRQEYPLTPEEAFISSGRPVFSQDKINKDIERLRDRPFRRCVAVGGELMDDPRGPYKIFKGPEVKKRYATGGDVAEGLEQGDASTQFMLDQNLEQVMSYYDRTHPALFGAEMVKVGKIYNEAILAPEVNNHGLTTLTHIMGENYKFVYTRQVWDERTNDYTAKAGWQTNSKTKHLMLDELIAAYSGYGDYKENKIKINDVDLLREMGSLTIEPDGSVNLNGKDRVVAACIALQAVKQLPSNDLGAFQSGSEKIKFKSLEEMLRYGQMNKGEESYFD